ncbi:MULTISPECIES: lipocalin family protein [Modicisalibacter]|uniref:Outer membrane lipoprotein Blc n=1 Tax=Modicisalibacter tunisiensis TaxID=390637 RepID=A0ABS7WZL6_9GAMM|nr:MULTISPECIES: lipocalin family protein [Modicisalibacter]MBZ9538812.1 lipocalin family protein [Modicisalibacter tunisiensis]MBZ9567780.1 lipocalin family protein [Modicisalibacter tunisiensis]
MSTRLPQFPRLTWLAPFSLLAGCTGLPDGTEPVRDFELTTYLGQWYEIARLPHRFEEGLDYVTATYERREDGGIRVINRGYDRLSGKWDEAEGRAYFIDQANVGRLKVSFFGPFYGGYNVLELDDDYRHALVAGPDRDYLWILARQPQLDETTYRALVGRAGELGFPVDDLVRVAQPGQDRPSSTGEA